jgi:hypothetical protein
MEPIDPAPQHLGAKRQRSEIDRSIPPPTIQPRQMAARAERVALGELLAQPLIRRPELHQARDRHVPERPPWLAVDGAQHRPVIFPTREADRAPRGHVGPRTHHVVDGRRPERDDVDKRQRRGRHDSRLRRRAVSPRTTGWW